MLPPIPHPIFSAFLEVWLISAQSASKNSVNPCNLWLKICKTNPISDIPKNDITPYPQITNHAPRTTIRDKKQTQFQPKNAGTNPKSNPNKPNLLYTVRYDRT
jgi:hypothetical protein